MRMRHLVLVAVALAAAPLMAACTRSGGGPQVATGDNRAPGGGSIQPAPAADEDERRRQFVSCMRSLGVELATPGGERREPSTTGPEADRANAALEQCRVYLPGEGRPPQPSQEDIEKAIAYARCVRENGVPYYPDPDPETGQPEVTTELGDRIKHDPQMPVADERCRNVTPAAHPEGTNPGGANG